MAPKATSKSAGAAPAKRPPLLAADVYCRIRPFASEGGHAEGGEADSRTLAGWDDASVTLETKYMFSSGESKYTFPKQVFPPDTTQETIFDDMMPRFLNNFLGTEGAEPQNVLFLAYGQTGTGKTHTMFGTDASLTSGVDDGDGWGLLPRVAQAVFEKTGAGDGQAILQGQAIEFYCMQAADLLNDGSPVYIDTESCMPVGASLRRLQSMEDLLSLIAQARANRTTRSTRMNTAVAGHEGSSRSHAALILHLLRRTDEGKVHRTFFSLIDLAGAERPSKTGETRVSGYEAWLEIIKKGGKNVSTGAQAAFINFELTLLRTAIVAARDAHGRGLKYGGEVALAPAMIKFLTGAMTGAAALGMVVTLSPCGSNGWETWFSLEYGKDMSMLRVPVRAVPAADADAERYVAALERELAAAIEKFAKTPISNSPASKYYAPRLGLALWQAQLVEDAYALFPDRKPGDGVEAKIAALRRDGDVSTFVFANNGNVDPAKLGSIQK